MAPQRVRNAPDDARSEASSTTKEKHPQLHHSPHSSAISKGKRVAGGAAGGHHTTVGSSNLKDVTSAPMTTARDGGGPGAGAGTEGGIGGINWSTLPISTLRAYRHAHRLNTPDTFSSPQNMLALTDPRGLGRFSPSMMGRRRRAADNTAGSSEMESRSRVGKESLALAVRKDFNAQAVSEMEVVTGFLYAVRNQNRTFRMRFEPGRGK